MLTTQQSFEVHPSAIKENTKPDSLGYSIVNVTYTIVTAKYQYPAIPITNYNTTFVFGPNSRDIILKDAETILTSGLYLPDRFSSLKEALKALKNKFELSNLPNSNYYPGLVCTAPAVNKDLILPLLTSMDNTFLPIPSESLIDLIKQEITTGNPFSLKGGKINYITYMDAGSPEAQHETSTSKSPDKVNPKEKPNDDSINIFLSCGSSTTDADDQRSILYNRITDLILANKNFSYPKPRKAPFNIISDKRNFNDDNTIDWYEKAITKFISNEENIDVLCLVLPSLTKPIDALDYRLMALANDHKIPIHIITSDREVKETISMKDFIKQFEKTYPNYVHVMYKQFIKSHFNLVIHPDGLDFIMKITKKRK